LADLIGRMAEAPLGADARWLDLSAEACVLQSRASAGLVHGIAHTLEPLLRGREARAFGHARLCSLFLLPVLRLDGTISEKWRDLCAAHGLDRERLESVARDLFDAGTYARLSEPLRDA